MQTQDVNLEERTKKPRISGPGESLANILENASEGGITRTEISHFGYNESSLKFLLEHNLLTTTDDYPSFSGVRFYPTAAYRDFDKQLLIYAFDIICAENRDSGKRRIIGRYLVKIKLLEELQANDASTKSFTDLVKNTFTGYERSRKILEEFVEKDYALKTGPDEHPSYSITPLGKKLLEGVYAIVQQLKEERERLVTIGSGIPIRHSHY